ncbi:hypothetical protein MMC28_005634 [Mycoblastus sanguinarius]|nr:hypothetical protein [Mycoblastus sanguinarius]
MAENSCHNDEPDITDDRPLAVRRKRRISTGLADPVDPTIVQHTQDPAHHTAEPAKTPSKPKKRVRFSDPGPELSTASSSTGLTPHLKRTSFTPHARASSPSRSRRIVSLPIQLPSSLPSPSLSPSPVPFSGEVQFAPLRQVLDERLKRRLRRNNLSEEINEIDAENRLKSKWRREIQDLKDELALAKQLGNENNDDGNAEAGSTDRIRELEQELVELREEIGERSTTTEPLSASIVPQNPPTPHPDIYIDNTDEDFIATAFDEDGVLRDRIQITPTQGVSEAATQASLPSPTHTETFRSARLSLEYLFPGEIALGLIPEDPKPMLDIMLERLQSLKAQALLAEDALSITQNQESNLRTQFNAVLEQLDRARKYAENVSKGHSSEKTRADGTQARVQLLEDHVQDSASRVKKLETDVNEKDRSIQKLQDALETYRVEVGKLESLITRIEGEHSSAMTDLRAEMDEAVADLECHVAAETIGRREAEQEVVQRDEKIKQLKLQEQGLKNAVNEKQQVIRETERVFAEERTGREREVGGLNVQIGQLTSDLDESNGKVAKAEEKQTLLMRKLQEERDAGLRAVEAVQAEISHCAEKAGDVKTAHVSDIQRRGAEVTEHKGLLTPVSACRFKDVEGYVEVRRGKGKTRRRPDSGIGVWEEEEDEDEDMIMADDF